MNHELPPRTLPRRANTIRAVAATMATKRRTIEAARQAVSDRIGYIVASVIGAVAYHYAGRRGLEIVVALYVLSAVVAYRRHKRIADQ